MVIKGSATKRNGERLHPAADVEQEGKKEKRGDGGERRGCVGARTEKKKKDNRERARRKMGERRERKRERDKEGLNGDRK